MSDKNQNASKKLKMEFNKVYGDCDYVGEISFYIDEQTEEYYQWKFETPDTATHIWRYFFETKTITKNLQLKNKNVNNKEMFLMEQTTNILNQIKYHITNYFMGEYEYSKERADEELTELTFETTKLQFAYTDLEASEINVSLNLKELYIEKELVVDVIEKGKAELIVREYVHFKNYAELIDYLEVMDFESVVSFDQVDAYELAGA